MGSMRHAIPLLIPAALVLGGCRSSASDHEVRGDRAYAAGTFEQALAEYRLALRQLAPSGRLRAKAGAAALRAGDREAAAAQFLALAREDTGRAAEAADGLERVARDALQKSDPAGLREALTGLQELAAGRALGGFARELAASLGDDPQPDDALAILPFAAAAAPDAGAQDSLMFEYGEALRRAGRCEAALAVFEGLVRRRRAEHVLGRAARRASACALALGRRALDRGEPAGAEEWFRRAVAQAGDNTAGRAAYVGLGDVMFARGDLDGAVEAYQRAMAGAAEGDSIAQVAGERLNAIANAGTVFR